MEFVITSGQILGFCAFLTAIWGAYKIVKELKRPSEDLRATVKKHDKCLEDDHSRLKALEESNKMILQCLLIIINHDITGNGIDQMKKCRNDLQAYLINK